MRRYDEDEVIDRLSAAPCVAEQIRLGEAMLNKALGLFEDGEVPAAIALVDEVVARFHSAESPVLKQEVAVPLQRKAAFLRESGQADGALVPYREIVARYGGSPDAEDPVIQFAVADAYFCLGYAQQLRNEYREATGAYLDAKEYADRSTDPKTRELSASLLINLVTSLLDVHDRGGARLFLDEFEDRFGKSSGPFYSEQQRRASILRRLADE